MPTDEAQPDVAESDENSDGPRPRILCLGDVMLDVIAILPAPLAPNSDTPAPIVLRHGGSAANTAAWLASLGQQTVFCGAVGSDAFGTAMIADLDARGVRTEVEIVAREPSGTCIVLVGADGERTMIPSAGANGALSRAHVDTLAMYPGDHLHISAYALFNDGSRSAALHAIERSAQLGVSLSVDAASSGPLAQVGADVFLRWLPGGTLLIANAAEAYVLTGLSDPRAAAALLSGRFEEVVVKYGRHGATYANGDRVDHVPTEPAEVLDSTGAGDAFAAGLLAALAGGSDLANAVVEGNRIGRQAVGTLGARPWH